MTRHRGRRHKVRRRGGVTLVEVMVSVAILGVAATGIAGMSYWAGRSGTESDLSASRQSVLSAATERMGALPYDRLGASAGCTAGEENGFPYLLCVRVEGQGEALMRVTVRVAPEGDLISADSVVLDRSRSAPTSPF